MSKICLRLSKQDLLKYLRDFLEKECPNIDMAKSVSVFVLEKEYGEEIEIASTCDSSGPRLCLEFKFEETKNE